MTGTTIVGTTVIAPGQVVSFDSSTLVDNYVYALNYDSGSWAALINRGEIHGTDNKVGQTFGLVGVSGGSPPGGPHFLVENYGLIAISSLNGDAAGLRFLNEAPNVRNAGKITVEALKAEGIGIFGYSWDYPGSPFLVDNSGELLVTAKHGLGIYLVTGNVTNTGSIRVVAGEGSGAAIVTVKADVLNKGVIEITDTTSSAKSVGIAIANIGLNFPLDGSLIRNEGTLKAEIAVWELDGADVASTLINIGIIEGAIELNGGADVVTNSGVLKGPALMGDGEDYYDGRLGSIIGIIDGGADNDILFGGADSETLVGGDGRDVLNGGGGNDVLTGGAGGDIFALSAGSDRITDFDLAADRISLNGKTLLAATIDGGDTILSYDGGATRVTSVTGLSLAQWTEKLAFIIVGTSVDEILAGTSDSDLIIGGAGRDTVSYADAANGVTVTLAAGSQQTGAGLDELVSIENLLGSRFADNLSGDAHGNFIWGGDGNDVLKGLDGDDVLDGGLGDDSLDGGAGIDVVDYSKATAAVTIDLRQVTQSTVMGVDTFISIEGSIGSAFNDVMIGGRLEGLSTNDLLLGDAGNDILFGGAGHDQLYGGAGNDTLTGGPGQDILDGGDGDDLILLDGYDFDQAFGGAGADSFRFLSGSWGMIKDFQSGVDHIDLSKIDVRSYFMFQESGYITLDVTDGTGAVMRLRVSSFYKGSDIILAGGAIPSLISSGVPSILRDNSGAMQVELANKVFAGTLTEAQAVAEIVKVAANTTSVATMSYQFFTGKIPTSAGLNYLVKDGGNYNDLSSEYYQTFNLENRYINFAVNLGKLGEGKDAFAAKYGILSLFDATREAYKIIFGAAPSDAKIHALIDTRSDYFAAYGGDGTNGVGTKAAMVGWLLAEAEKADLGVMAKSNDAWLTDLADGSAHYAIDILDPSKGYWKADFVFGGG